MSRSKKMVDMVLKMQDTECGSAPRTDYVFVPDDELLTVLNNSALESECIPVSGDNVIIQGKCT